MKLKIISYNILADYLNSPNYIKVDKKYLDNDNRIKLLLKKLKKLISNESIFCLQEVGYLQLSILQTFFFKHKFQMIYTGDLAIVFPFEKFKIKKLELGYIKDLKYLINKKHHEQLDSKKKFYIILTLRSIKKNRNFTIANTHLIASPELNNLKFLQTAVLLKKLDEYYNVILCGDFNSKPDYDNIKLIQNNEINNSLGKFKINNKYNIAHDLDQITTHTKNIASGIFTEMLDYIVVQKNIKINSVSKLKKRDKYNSKNILPNKTEPSDHIVIYADVSI